jgi:hypothetical protein
MQVYEEDLDGKPETVDNIVLRDNRKPEDLYAIDGLRIGDRKKAMVKRGVYEEFDTRDKRSSHRDFINKTYKRYLRKFIKPEDRQKHPFTEELANKIAADATDNASLFQRISDLVRNDLNTMGIRVKNGDRTVLTVPHYGYITSKIASNAYKVYYLPKLAALSSVWRAYGDGSNYDFNIDEDDLLSRRDFKDSMNGIFQRGGVPKPITAWYLFEVARLSQDPRLLSEGVKISTNQNSITGIQDEGATLANLRRQQKQARQGRIPGRDILYDQYARWKAAGKI